MHIHVVPIPRRFADGLLFLVDRVYNTFGNRSN